MPLETGSRDIAKVKATTADSGGYSHGSLRDRARKAEHEQHFYLRMLQQYFHPGIYWLDAGCGHTLIRDWLPGAKEIERSFLAEAGKIVGADVDPLSLEKPSAIPRVACSLDALTFDDGSFDLITCNMVVEHLETPAKVFKEFFRVIRPGGIVVILTPNIYHWSNVLSMITPFGFHRWILKTLYNRETEDVFPTLYRCNTKRAMQRLLTSAGFSAVDVHMVPGRQHLIKFGPLFYLEYLFYQLSLKAPQLREILCAVAQKAPQV